MREEDSQELSFRESLVSASELDECDRFDLSRIGAVQGGAANVIFFKYPENIITAVDAQVLSLPFLASQDKTKSDCVAADLLETNMAEWMPKDIVQKINETVKDMVKQATLRGFGFFTEASKFYAFSASTTLRDHSVSAVEFEEMDNDAASASLHSALAFLRQIMDFQEGAPEQAAKVACDTMYKVLGCYDRAMVYRFIDDYSGGNHS